MQSSVDKNNPLVAQVYARGNWMHLFHPRAFNAGEVPKYSAEIIVESGSQAHEVLASIARAAARSEWGAAVPEGCRFPISNAQVLGRKGAAYEGAACATAKARYAPTLLTGIPEAMKTAKVGDMGNGDWCMFTLRAYAYRFGAGAGVALNLRGVFVVNRDPLGGSLRVSRLDRAAVEASMRSMTTERHDAPSDLDRQTPTLHDLIG
jgi:hypothetical protein